MKTRFFISSLLCLGMLGAASLRAQSARLATSFSREVNQYKWQSMFDFEAQTGKWAFDVHNRFNSSAFILFENRLSFRDENQLQWQALRPLGSRLTARVFGNANWYSLSRVLGQQTLAGLRVQVDPETWIEPVAGIGFDRRPGSPGIDNLTKLRADAGPAYGLRAGYKSAEKDKYKVNFLGNGVWQTLTPRRARHVALTGTAEGEFEKTRLTSTVKISSIRRDTYQSVSFLNRDPGLGRTAETVEATTSDTVQIGVGIQTPVLGKINLDSRLDFMTNRRTIRTLRAAEDALFFDTDFNRQAIDAEIGSQYATRRWHLQLAVHTGAERERRALNNDESLPDVQAAQKSLLLDQADFDRGYFTLNGQTRWIATDRATLMLEGSASILRHDTPEINLDDRDEVFYTGSFGIQYKMSNQFQFDTRLFGAYNHIVYLKSARSGDNNIQRSLRLRPSLRWRPGPRTDVQFLTELRATYTVDDFILPGRRPTDQSARELRYQLSVEQDFGEGVRLRAEGAFSDLRLGRFLNDIFAEIPFDTLQTYSGWVRLQTGKRITAEIGIRFLIRSDYSRSTSVSYPAEDANGVETVDLFGKPRLSSITRPGREIISQIGPTFAVVWPMRKKSALRLDGWLTRQHVWHKVFGELPESAVDRIQKAAKKGARSVIPNLSVSAIWVFR